MMPVKSLHVLLVCRAPVVAHAAQPPALPATEV